MKRLNFVVEDDVYERLENLKKKTEARSLAEVFRDALRSYAWIISEFEQGNEVVSRPAEEERKPYLFGLKDWIHRRPDPRAELIERIRERARRYAKEEMPVLEDAEKELRKILEMQELKQVELKDEQRKAFMDTLTARLEDIDEKKKKLALFAMGEVDINEPFLLATDRAVAKTFQTLAELVQARLRSRSSEGRMVR
jgi:hypothetical protein